MTLQSKSSLYDTLSEGQFSLERFFNFALKNSKECFINHSNDAIKNPFAAYADILESPKPISEEDEQVENLDISNDSWMTYEDDDEEIEETSPLSNGLSIHEVQEHQDLYVVQSNFKSSLIEQELEHEK